MTTTQPMTLTFAMAIVKPLVTRHNHAGIAEAWQCIESHIAAQGDVEKDAAKWRMVRDNRADGLRIIVWRPENDEELQILFPTKEVCDRYADIAIAKTGGEG